MQLRGAAPATPSSPTSTTTPRASASGSTTATARRTTYEYDPLTFRLIASEDHAPGQPRRDRIAAVRDPTVVQDLRYTYDPVGNITRIEDAALNDGLPRRPARRAVGAYTYDAIYRLIEAAGASTSARTAFDFDPPNGDYRDYPFVGHRRIPTTCRRCATTPSATSTTRSATSWTLPSRRDRRRLDAPLRLRRGQPARARQEEQPADENHRRQRAQPRRALHARRPRQHDLDAAPGGDAGTSRTSCSRSGLGRRHGVTTSTTRRQRVRKVIESQNGTRQQERIYLGGFEIYREFDADGIDVSSSASRCTSWTTSSASRSSRPRRSQNGNAVARARAVTALPTRQPPRLGERGARQGRRADLVRGIPPLRHDIVPGRAQRRRGKPEALSIHGQGARRGDRASATTAPVLRRLAGEVGQCDPFGLMDGVNLYWYAASSPITRLDPLGAQSETNEASPAQVARPLVSYANQSRSVLSNYYYKYIAHPEQWKTFEIKGTVEPRARHRRGRRSSVRSHRRRWVTQVISSWTS